MSKFQIAKGLLENLPDDYTEGKVYFIYDNVNTENLNIYADIDGIRRKINTIYTLPPATTGTLGGVKVGDGLSVAADGTASIADGAVTGTKLAQDVKEAINISSAADALMGDPSESTWATRESTGSGMARVESVQGAAVVWNQLALTNVAAATKWGLTTTMDPSTGIVTIAGTATQSGNLSSISVANTQGHKYLIFGNSSDAAMVRFSSQTYGTDDGNGVIITNNSANKTWCYTFLVLAGAVGQEINVTFRPQVYDLTQMFGAGNEPSTVAEFEALFPEPYYPYDAGSLLPVRMEGVETVGFNQWDEVWEVGDISASTGWDSTNSEYWRSKGYMPVFPSTTYYITAKDFTPTSSATGDMRGRFYDADKNYIGTNDANGQTLKVGRTFTTPANAHYLRFSPKATNVPTKEVCVNISDPSRNGTYEPYWSSQRVIPASTYFPDGMRSAGTVRDELTATQAITRVGVVDLGTLTWNYNSSNGVFNARFDGGVGAVGTSAIPNISCARYETGNYSEAVALKYNVISYAESTHNLYVRDQSYTDKDTFAAAMSGVYLYYELATPTTQPISPALPMTYRIEQGGTESIVVPEGEVSAAPVITVAEGESAADLVMDALAAIATPDGPTATANHAVGTYLTMQGKLYKVTSAIAAGESIVAGTNVTETTVMYDTRMVVLEYGVSTWDDFLAAYEANRVVYCRVSSAYGFRMAFLAFVQTTGSRPGAEFQYYRSMSAHTATQQGDEVHIYHLSPDGTWTTTVRNAYTRIVAGDGLKSTYANGVLTISLDQ